MLSDYYDKTARVDRLTVVEELYEPTNKKAFAIHIAELPCYLQALEDSITQDISVGFGKNWVLFCDIEDIIEGDRIFIEDKEYRITGIETFEDSRNPHMEIKIRIFES